MHVQHLRCHDGQNRRRRQRNVGIRPASFKVIRHVRPKLACQTCGPRPATQTIVQSPAPSRPIDRGLPGPALRRTSWSANTAIICRCIARARCTPARVWNWNAPPWPIGSAAQPSSSRRCLRHYEITCYRPRYYTPTTPRCRCFNPAKAKPRPVDCGPMFETGDPPAVPTLRRCGLLIRRIVRASIPCLICKTLGAYCKPMAMPGSNHCTSRP